MSALPNPIQPTAPTPVPAKPTVVPHGPKPGGPWKGLTLLALIAALGYKGYQWLAKPATDTTVFASVKTIEALHGLEDEPDSLALDDPEDIHWLRQVGAQALMLAKGFV